MRLYTAHPSPVAVTVLASAVLVVAGCGASTTTPPATVAPAGSGPASASPIPTVASPSVAPSTAAETPPSGPLGAPPFDPANFVAAVTNPWFPLVPGTTLTYRGTSGGEPALDVVEVSSETRVIVGVACVVVHDTVTIAGTLAEKTSDYYAQDAQGNVWYLGEDTAEYDEAGKVVSTEGTWQAGVDGASAGIFMPAVPFVGRSLQQEFYAGHAEDYVVVLFMDTSLKVPGGTFDGVLVTGEWTPLEPGVLGEKWYAMGIGQIKEADVAGGDEEFALVAVSGP